VTGGGGGGFLYFVRLATDESVDPWISPADSDSCGCITECSSGIDVEVVVEVDVGEGAAGELKSGRGPLRKTTYVYLESS